MKKWKFPKALSGGGGEGGSVRIIIIIIISSSSSTQNHHNHNHHHHHRHHHHHLTNHHQVSPGIVWRRGRRVSEDNSDLAGQATCWQAMQNLTNHHLRHHCHHHHQHHYLYHPGNHFHPRHCHLGQLVCLFTGGSVFHVLPAHQH